eukprot:COSAG02_NODE_10407_length_1947_cov_1.637446_3_plen_234_part_00
MEVKPSPMNEFVQVGAPASAPPSDPLVDALAAAGVAETGKLADHLRGCHLDESSVVTLDHEDLLEVLQSAKEAGVSVGDRAKLKALVKRSTSNYNFTAAPGPPPAASPPHQGHAAGQPPPAPAPPASPAPKRLVVMFNQIVQQLVPLRVGVVELIDSVVSQYFAPAFRNNSMWPRIVTFMVVMRGLGAVFKRRHGSNALAAFLCGYFIRPRPVGTEAAEEAPSPAPAPAPAAE